MIARYIRVGIMTLVREEEQIAGDKAMSR